MDVFLLSEPVARAAPVLLTLNDAPQGGMGSSLVMMAVIFAIFWFLLIMPQRKEQKAHEALLSGLQKGDRVATTAGIHGRIQEVGDETVVLEIAEKVRVTLDKPTIKRRLDAPSSK